jgi:hypothetical protein
MAVGAHDMPPASHEAQQTSLAQRLHAARNRELPEQRTALPADLADRMRDQARNVADRLSAAQQLLRATKPGSTIAREATDEFLVALAACGDTSKTETTLHGQLLDDVRNDGGMLVRLEHRLASVADRIEWPDDISAKTTEVGAVSRVLPHRTLAAIVVAARVENDRLDAALRRALRRDEAIADIIASSLRCGIRLHGATELLLACWHDEVAIGRQQDSQDWAEFWFRGQAASSFARLEELSHTKRSAAERIRCLLAMGCVNDASTLPRLCAGLDSPRLLEASAAACSLSCLPHRILRQLIPKAKQPESDLLRAALARAGLPESQPWLQPLALSKQQLHLLRKGPVTKFSEATSWFRNGPLVAD